MLSINGFYLKINRIYFQVKTVPLVQKTERNDLNSDHLS